MSFNLFYQTWKVRGMILEESQGRRYGSVLRFHNGWRKGVRTEWHQLKFLSCCGVTISVRIARLLHQLVLLGASFQHSWFLAAWPVANAKL